MSDPYLDALEQLDQMRDRAFKAEAAIAGVREVCRDPTRQMRTTDPFWITVEWVDLNAVLNALDGPDE